MTTTTFTLLILLYGPVLGVTPELATVPGFTLESACIKAGYDLKNKRPSTDYLFYECIEVK